MIYSMITGDMFTFGIIYSIVLCGFSQAFYFLYKGHPQVQSTMFNTYTSTWMALFQTTLGDYNVSMYCGSWQWLVVELANLVVEELNTLPGTCCVEEVLD